jgi:hypothetical protein
MSKDLLNSSDWSVYARGLNNQLILKVLNEIKVKMTLLLSQIVKLKSFSDFRNKFKEITNSLNFMNLNSFKAESSIKRNLI